MPKNRIHVTAEDGVITRMDALASRWGLTRSTLLTFLVNRAFLEERIREENTTK